MTSTALASPGLTSVPFLASTSSLLLTMCAMAGLFPDVDTAIFTGPALVMAHSDMWLSDMSSGTYTIWLKGCMPPRVRGSTPCPLLK